MSCPFSLIKFFNLAFTLAHPPGWIMPSAAAAARLIQLANMNNRARPMDVFSSPSNASDGPSTSMRSMAAINGIIRWRGHYAFLSYTMLEDVVKR